MFQAGRGGRLEPGFRRRAGHGGRGPRAGRLAGPRTGERRRLLRRVGPGGSSAGLARGDHARPRLRARRNVPGRGGRDGFHVHRRLGVAPGSRRPARPDRRGDGAQQLRETHGGPGVLEIWRSVCGCGCGGVRILYESRWCEHEHEHRLGTDAGVGRCGRFRKTGGGRGRSGISPGARRFLLPPRHGESGPAIVVRLPQGALAALSRTSTVHCRTSNTPA